MSTTRPTRAQIQDRLESALRALDEVRNDNRSMETTIEFLREEIEARDARLVNAVEAFKAQRAELRAAQAELARRDGARARIVNKAKDEARRAAFFAANPEAKSAPAEQINAWASAQA